MCTCQLFQQKLKKGAVQTFVVWSLLLFHFFYIVYLCKTCWIKNLNIHLCSILCVWNCENELKCTKRTHAHTHTLNQKIILCILTSFWMGPTTMPLLCMTNLEQKSLQHVAPMEWTPITDVIFTYLPLRHIDSYCMICALWVRTAKMQHLWCLWVWLCVTVIVCKIFWNFFW